MAVSDHNLIWVDMEMTGLMPEAHRVIEIATIVTDSNLTVLAEGPVLAIHQPPEALDAMDEWNTRTHTGSGAKTMSIRSMLAATGRSRP